MDAEKFGAFIAVCRKEKNMTQAELAQKIKVTDKAVSRWERGKGFPDISILVPLSDALDISLPELMNSGKSSKRNDNISNIDLKYMITDMAEMDNKNRQDNRIIAWTAYPVVIITALWAVLSGHASILAAWIFGAAVALAITGLYLFAVNQNNTSGRRIYGIFMILGTGLSLLFSYLMGFNSSILLCVVFILFSTVVGIVIR